jgi:hypothetical protein
VIAGALFVIFCSGVGLANVPPVVDALTTSSTTVAPGGAVQLTLGAHDPDCPDTCTSGCGQYIRADLFSWSATDGTFVNQTNSGSGSPFTATTDWQAPATEGIYTISVYVPDSGGFMCGGRLDTTADLDVLVTLSTNDPPVVGSLVAESLQLFPGESTALTCAGSDPNDDPLTYSWEADSGTITPGEAGAAVFLASDPGAATVTCTVSDPQGAFGEASIVLSVIGASPERALVEGLVAPHRLSVDSKGSVYVIDPSSGGISVFNLLSGRLIYRLPISGATSVAVDWSDNLLVGGHTGAVVMNRAGVVLLTLVSDEPLGEVVDVAVDPVGRRYGVLHRAAARVVIFDEFGTKVGAFGSNGDGPGEFKSLHGLAVDPAGNWGVADSGHGRIKTFDSAGTLLSTIGDLGGGGGEFVQLDDVAVDSSGVIYASDSFQDWVQTFNPDGTPREILGTYGADSGEFKTATGIALAPAFDRLLACSTNSSSVQVFVTTSDPVVTGPEPQADVQPDALTFDPQAVGTSSATQSVTVANLGDAPLGLRRVSVPADFAETHACAFVEPGAVCTIDVKFAPTTVGVLSGILTLDTSAAGTPEEIPLSGIGFLPADLVYSPTRLDFSDQEVGSVSEPKPLVLANVGTAPLSLLDITTSGEFLQSNDCSASLPGGASCTVHVSFAPQTVADYINGTVTVSSAAAGSPHSAELEGRGIPGAVSVTVGDRTVQEGAGELVFPVTLSNPGLDVITVSYTTVADSAEEGTDYEPASGLLAFAPGETSGTIPVTLLDDGLLEPLEESLLMVLSDPIGAELDDLQALGTIVDDERCAGPELLVNSGAEQPSAGPGIPGWTASAGNDWNPAAAPPDPFEGNAYFSAGTSDTAELVQDVDVSAYAGRIAGAGQRFAFEGRVRSRDEALPDSARVVVEYRNTDNTEVLDAFDSGELVSTADWMAVTDERSVPNGTGWIRVRLIATRQGGAENDGYFDGLSLRSLRAATVQVADAWQYEGDHLSPGVVHFPVTLGCAWQQPVTIGFATIDGTAVAGDDYLAASGSVTLASGETELRIPVTMIGDTMDEDHESFGLQLELSGRATAVLLDGTAVGRIVNDDFCQQELDWWMENVDAWPVDRLTIGAEELNRQELIDLLDMGGGDRATRLARELVVTKLNLAEGSDPRVLPVVEAADAFLVEFPPGSDSHGANAARARILRRLLLRYNRLHCDEPLWRWRRRWAR